MESPVSFRLKNARIQNGFSLQQVADRLGISRQMVCKYEHGTMPASEKLIALAKLFNQKTDYFFRPSEVHIGTINFRKKSQFSSKKINALKEEVRNRIENYLLIENLCRVENSFKNPVGKMPVKSRQDIIAAVNHIRKEWKTGHAPLHNIVEVMERNEIKVIEVEDRTQQFDGLATVIDDKYFVIVINKNMPVERKRFTLLHELGHLILDLKGKTEKEMEKYCHWFASEMLLSTENMKIEFGHKRRQITTEELKNMQSKYGISIQAIVYKLSEAGIISEEKRVSFYKTVNANSSLKKEMDQPRFAGHESSTRYQNLVYCSLSEETISISKASALLHTTVTRLCQNLSINI